MEREQALRILNALANGVHPATGEQFGSDSPYQHPDTVRALYESIRAMQARGLQVRTLTPELEREWRRMAESSWPLVRGNMVPADTFDRVRGIVAEYRAGAK